MYPQVLHKLFMLNLLPPLVVTFDLVFQFFDPVAFVSVLRQFFSAEIGSVQQLLFE